MSNAMRWSTALKPDEMWLNSDREILGRMKQSRGKQGILLTVRLPNNTDFQAEVDRLNGQTGGQYCHMVREYYNEWKSGLEAESRRRHRDREQQALVDAAGQSLSGGSGEAAGITVDETVQALEERVSGSASLEEEIVSRLDRATGRRSKLREQREALERELAKLDNEVEQLERMKAVFDASAILEQASGSVRQTAPDSRPEATVGDVSREPEADPGGDKGAEPEGA